MRVNLQSYEVIGDNQVKWYTDTTQERVGQGVDESQGPNKYSVKGYVILTFVRENNQFKIQDFFTRYSKTLVG